MVRPLLFSLKELKENPLRSFIQKATSQLAQQAAAAERPTEILDLQANIDEDAEAILLAAAERMGPQGQESLLPQRRRHQHQQLTAHPAEERTCPAAFGLPSSEGHQWVPFRTGVACKQCKQKLHTKSPFQELRDALTNDCSTGHTFDQTQNAHGNDPGDH